MVWPSSSAHPRREERVDHARRSPYPDGGEYGEAVKLRRTSREGVAGL